MDMQKKKYTDFNPTNYLNNYADLTAAFGSNTEAATRHYITNGYAEGRTDTSKGSSSGGLYNLTDLEAYNYIASNNDLISAFGTDIAAAKNHYINHGKAEGRNLTRFSASIYLEKYSDLKAAFGDDETSALNTIFNMDIQKAEQILLPVLLPLVLVLDLLLHHQRLLLI